MCGIACCMTSVWWHARSCSHVTMWSKVDHSLYTSHNPSRCVGSNWPSLNDSSCSSSPLKVSKWMIPTWHALWKCITWCVTVLAGWDCFAAVENVCKHAKAQLCGLSKLCNVETFEFVIRLWSRLQELLHVDGWTSSPDTFGFKELNSRTTLQNSASQSSRTDNFTEWSSFLEQLSWMTSLSQVLEWLDRVKFWNNFLGWLHRVRFWTSFTECSFRMTFQDDFTHGDITELSSRMTSHSEVLGWLSRTT